ncbi:hypothetical protein SNOG_15518 [Parastagonospora nodorum SN15]|uniref:Uncharacterized protein n=1 Tax=Phaeosphaeria nodorum (strain SN15 / ATCC MYA-4574 / FGSC 10173) TaxID=321614 RepID=Q0TYI5_PHANO|nr:hypothetical protein SNOG_15518 [Parastagonospora nodorum SN15]EAT77183.2 hypothetical protein SNOG_15518 [Parastagonospora nodorum SN15]
MVIGFNGRSKDYILAQHLFTSFIWTIVDHLPKNVLRQSVLEREQDGDFEGRSNNVLLTGSRSRLRDRTLVKLVRQLQEFGLGNETDILLCVIPAFSFRDLLPNHALLETIPQIRHGKSLVGTANGYIKLLEQSLSIAPYGTTVEGKFWYTLVVAAIDFLFFASEPYDEYIQAPEELRTALQDVVLFGGGEDLPGCLKALEVPDKKLDYVFFEGSLGFSKSYRAVYEAFTENKRNAYDTVGIDGMSPLHLATKNGHARLVEKIMKKKRLRTTTGVDFWGRAAIHLAASHGHGAITKLLLGNDSQFDAVDEIGKTPLEYLLKVDRRAAKIIEKRNHEDNT